MVARRPGDAEAGATIVVPTADGTTRLGGSPRLRTGYALKRLEAAEGDRRWVLKDLRSGQFVRLSTADAELLPLIDGSRSVAALIAAAGRLQGEAGPERLTVLLAALAERGCCRGRCGDGGRAGGPRVATAARAADAVLVRCFRVLRATVRGRRRPVADAPGAGGAGRARVHRARRVFCADRRALRDAVHRRQQGGHRRGRVRARAARGRGGARDGARAGHGVVRAPGARSRFQARARLPLRVCGHVGRVVRAEAAADRGQRRRAGERPLPRRRLRARLPGGARQAADHAVEQVDQRLGRAHEREALLGLDPRSVERIRRDAYRDRGVVADGVAYELERSSQKRARFSNEPP